VPTPFGSSIDTIAIVMIAATPVRRTLVLAAVAGGSYIV
jgi:hypothetical protein